MKWLLKLIGFDFEITYKKSSDNGDVDALSRVNTGGQLLPMVLTFVTTDLLSKIVQSWDNDPILHTMIQNLKAGVFATTQRIQGYCYRRKMKKQVKEFDGLRFTYFWIKEQIEKERGEGFDLSVYGSSKVVGTQAPVQLGSLRAADGKE
nr:GDP-mannose 3,5-epimerase 2 [Tanacetum cinerariifolium]